MAIHVTCAVCGHKLTAPDSAAGTAGKCPKCGELLRIPVPPAARLTVNAGPVVPGQPVTPASTPGAAEHMPPCSTVTPETSRKAAAYAGLQSAGVILTILACALGVGGGVALLIGWKNAAASSDLAILGKEVAECNDRLEASVEESRRSLQLAEAQTSEAKRTLIDRFEREDHQKLQKRLSAIQNGEAGGGLSSSEMRQAQHLAWVTLLCGVSAAVVGAALYGFGQSCLALRDIARNTGH